MAMEEGGQQMGAMGAVPTAAFEAVGGRFVQVAGGVVKLVSPQRALELVERRRRQRPRATIADAQTRLYHRRRSPQRAHHRVAVLARLETFGKVHHAAALRIRRHPTCDGCSDLAAHGAVRLEPRGVQLGISASDPQSSRARGERAIAQRRKGDRLDARGAQRIGRLRIGEPERLVVRDGDRYPFFDGLRRGLVVDACANGVTRTEFVERKFFAQVLGQSLHGRRALLDVVRIEPEVALSRVEGAIMRNGREDAHAGLRARAPHGALVVFAADAIENHARDPKTRIELQTAQRHGGRRLRAGPEIEHQDDGHVEQRGDARRRRRTLVVAVEETHHPFEDQRLRAPMRATHVTHHALFAVEPQVDVIRRPSADALVERGVDVVGPDFIGLNRPSGARQRGTESRRYERLALTCARSRNEKRRFHLSQLPLASSGGEPAPRRPNIPDPWINASSTSSPWKAAQPWSRAARGAWASRWRPLSPKRERPSSCAVARWTAPSEPRANSRSSVAAPSAWPATSATPTRSPPSSRTSSASTAASTCS